MMMNGMGYQGLPALDRLEETVPNAAEWSTYGKSAEIYGLGEGGFSTVDLIAGGSYEDVEDDDIATDDSEVLFFSETQQTLARNIGTGLVVLLVLLAAIAVAKRMK